MLRHQPVAGVLTLALSLALVLALPAQTYAQAKPQPARQQTDPIIEQQDRALQLYTAGKYQEAFDLLLKNAPLARAKFGELSENHAWVLNLIANSDLSASFGLIGQPLSPTIQTEIEKAGKRICAAGKAAGILAGGEEDSRRYIGWGYNFVAAGVDTVLLTRAADDLAAKMKR